MIPDEEKKKVRGSLTCSRGVTRSVSTRVPRAANGEFVSLARFECVILNLMIIRSHADVVNHLQGLLSIDLEDWRKTNFIG